jgi:hypothetical protein
MAAGRRSDAAARVDLAGDGVGPLGRLHASLEDALGLGVGGADLGGGRLMPDALDLDPARRQGSTLASSSTRPALAGRHGGDDRRADLLGQALQVDAQALALGDVEHVQGQHERPAHLLQLQHQAQDEPQVGGVGHADQGLGRDLAGQLAQHRVAGDDSSGLRARRL